MLKRIFAWLKRGWPILAFLPLLALHFFLLELPWWSSESFNKTLALILQILGGLIILDSIDSNLGQFKKRGLLYLFLDWLKSFPVKREQVVSSKVDFSFPMFRVDAVANTSYHQTFATVQETLDYLQSQINQLQEKQNEDKKTLLKKITDTKDELIGEDKKTDEQITTLSEVIESVAIGSIKMQLFGFMLLIYSAVLGFLS